LSLLLVHELDQVSQVFPDLLQHRKSHEFPEVIGLDFEDRLHLGVDHRDGLLLLQSACQLADPLLIPGQLRVMLQDR